MNFKNDSKNIIEIVDNEPRISHRIIADQKNVAELINKYRDKLELFGAIPFKTEVLKAGKGTTKNITHFLNESQATLLLTFMRNNEVVINFKIRLVQDFFKMRNQLQISKPIQKQTNLISVSTENMRKEFEALEFAFKNFKMSENEKRILTNKVFEKLNFPTLEIQPKRKTEPVFTLTKLLENFKISFSPYEMNLKFQSFGILQKVGGYWFLENLKFGVNESYDNYKNPKYYKSTFQALLNIVL